MFTQQTIIIPTPGRGMVDITDQIKALVAEAGYKVGLCNLFLLHTSASILICENAEETVQQDMELFMQRIAPDGADYYKHTTEGPDDMPSHIRTVLTQSTITLPIKDNQLILGTWQGVYLWEHRYRQYQRKLTVTLMGE